MSSIDGVNETEYKGCTIKTSKNSDGSWYWKIDKKRTSLNIHSENGNTFSERQARKEAEEKIDEAVKDAM